MDLQAYESQAESMTEELMREELLTGTGQKDTYEISGIYDRYAGLFDRDEVRKRLGDRQDSRRMNLAAFAVQGHFGRQVRELSETIVNSEMNCRVRFGDEEISYREAPVRVQNEQDRQVRQGWDDAYTAAMAGLNPLYARYWSQTYTLTTEMGFACYRQMCDTLVGLRLAWLKQSAESILAATAGRWPERVRSALASVGAASGDGTTADMSHYFRAREFDAHFPADQLLPVLQQTLAGLGIDMDAQANLRLDIEDRPLKSPRAFCAPVRVPDEVWLVIKPHGGQDDYGSLLHEAGHAEHFTHTDAGLPFSLRGLGDSSVTETYAFLFNNLLFNERWLSRYLGGRDWSGFLRFNQFSETWMLRRYCSKLLYEWELHSGASVEAPALYSEVLEEHLGVRISPERCLVDVDDGFYVAQYLRAWHLEAQLRRRLESDYGMEWFADRRAGEFLISLWQLGESLDAWELAVRLGFGGLDASALIDTLTRPA